MRHIFAVALVSLVVLAGNASACLNDREIQGAEREFKSSYIEKATPEMNPSPPVPETKDRLLVWGGAGFGTALLLGALVVGLTLPRKAS